MYKFGLAILMSVMMQACGAANASAESDTLYCESAASHAEANIVAAASGFCEMVRSAMEQQLGIPLRLVKRRSAEWAISVIMDRYESQAEIVHAVSGEAVNIRFDIMDASIDPQTIEPFAADIAKMAIEQRETS